MGLGSFILGYAIGKNKAERSKEPETIGTFQRVSIEWITDPLTGEIKPIIPQEILKELAGRNTVLYLEVVE